MIRFLLKAAALTAAAGMALHVVKESEEKAKQEKEKSVSREKEE